MGSRIPARQKIESDRLSQMRMPAFGRGKLMFLSWLVNAFAGADRRRTPIATRRLLCCLLSLLPQILPSAEWRVTSATEAGLSEQKLSEVDRFMERQVAELKIAGAVIIIAHDGKIGFFHTYGQMDREAGKPMRRDTIFRLYSMTKAITTAAALHLVDAGKIGLDDPVSRYLPAFGKVQVATEAGPREPGREMTIRDLMRHTSGLTYGTAGPEAHKEAFGRMNPRGAPNLKEMCDRLSQIPLAFDPGTNWTCSVSPDVLARVIEVVSGASLDAFLRKTIFEPLDMRDIGYRVPPPKLDRLAANYSRSPTGLKPIESPELKFDSGSTGLKGTASDYMRFLLMIQDGGEFEGRRILRPETVKRMITNQLPAMAYPIHFESDPRRGILAEVRHGTGFGLGFSVRDEIKTWDSTAHVGEYGWDGSASTHYWVSPADRLIVITLEQVMPFQWDTEFGVKKLIYDAIRN